MTNPFAAAAAEQAQSEAIKAVDKVPVVPGRKVHIDGDYLCYYASGNDETEPGMARLNALDFIQRAKDYTGSEKAVLHLTASGCHKGERYLAATVKPYQGQRSSDRRPKNWRYLREWGTGYKGAEFVSKVWSSREADDGIATCAEYAVRQGRLDAIATADKDMQMLPGVHLDWKDHSILTEVPPDTYEVIGKNGKVYGLRWFWLQMLQGDSADNIPGLEYAFFSVVPGKPERMNKVGPKTAENLLRGIRSHDEAAQAVLDLYVRSYRGTGDGYDRFCEQACLLWMRRGNKADVLDFMDYMPRETDHRMELFAASRRLDDRIKAARAALDEARS